MTRRSTVWRVAAWLFILTNLAGGAFAAVQGEVSHAAVHGGLLLVGAYVVWRLGPRARWHDSRLAMSADERLERLQQSVEAIAIEVERIGEAQRFSVKLIQERAEARR
jgi:hypothetical protein